MRDTRNDRAGVESARRASERAATHDDKALFFTLGASIAGLEGAWIAFLGWGAGKLAGLW